MEDEIHAGITNYTPTRNVNFESSVSNGQLFVNSAIIADNESHRDFERNSVIDVYNLTDGSYKISFYIPYYMGRRMQHFKVYKNGIIVLYNDAMIVFQLPAGLLVRPE